MSAPDPLRRAVARDLRPVRPLAPPFRRALLLVPLALAIVAAVPLLNFFRSDMKALGVFGSWGLSVGEAFAGVLVVGLALRESVPGRLLSGTAIALTVICGLTLPYAVMAATAKSFQIGSGAGWADAVNCFLTSVLAAVPALVVSAALAFRALPVRPATAGALFGLGSGLVGDAGLRLFCEFTVPSHFFGAHDGAVAAVVMAGVVVGKGIASRRATPRP